MSVREDRAVKPPRRIKLQAMASSAPMVVIGGLFIWADYLVLGVVSVALGLAGAVRFLVRPPRPTEKDYIELDPFGQSRRGAFLMFAALLAAGLLLITGGLAIAMGRVDDVPPAFAVLFAVAFLPFSWATRVLYSLRTESALPSLLDRDETVQVQLTGRHPDTSWLSPRVDVLAATERRLVVVPGRLLAEPEIGISVPYREIIALRRTGPNRLVVETDGGELTRIVDLPSNIEKIMRIARTPRA